MDQVEHPVHYNSHPSGVEAIEITEHLGFNTGNAFKYLFRRDSKHEDPNTDLRKALWYAKREAVNLNFGEHLTVEALLEPKLEDFDNKFFSYVILVFPELAAKTALVLKHEKSPWILGALAHLVRGHMHQDAADLFVAAHFIERAIGQ